MKTLTKAQKKILKNITNKKTRSEQKTQFKLQNAHDRQIVFVNGEFKTDSKKMQNFLNNHPFFGITVGDETSTTVQLDLTDFNKKVDEIEAKNMGYGLLTSCNDLLKKINRKSNDIKSKTWYKTHSKMTEEKFKETDKMIQNYLEKIWFNKHSLKLKSLTKDNFVSKLDENGKIVLGKKQNKTVIDDVNKTITFSDGTIYDMSKFKQDKINNPKPKAGFLLPYCDNIIFESYNDALNYRAKKLKNKTLTKEALRDLTKPKNEAVNNNTETFIDEFKQALLQELTLGECIGFKERCKKQNEGELAVKFKEKEFNILCRFNREKLHSLVKDGILNINTLYKFEKKKKLKESKEINILFPKPEGEMINLERILKTTQVKEESVAKKVIAELLESTKPTKTVEPKTRETESDLIYNFEDMRKCFIDSQSYTFNPVIKKIAYKVFNEYIENFI